MGVRLYINSEDNAVVEMCAGVPAGTTERLKEFKDNFKPSGNDDPAYELYCAIRDNEDFSKLDHYQLFGWGKFTYPVDSYAGHATGDEAIGMWLSSTGTYSDKVKALILEHGVYWC